MRRPAVFFDRDNTLIVGNDYLGDPERVVLVAGAAAAVASCRQLGFAVVVVSNQSGVARGMFDEAAVRAVNQKMDALLLAAHPAAVIDRHEYCPHHPQGTVAEYAIDSPRRKPGPGMILDAAEAMALDLPASWVIGDAPRDVAAGRAAGCRTILIVDPTLPPSPAASAAQETPADFTVGSLVEAANVVAGQAARPTPLAAAAVPAAVPAAAVPSAPFAPPAAAPPAAPSPASVFDADAVAAVLTPSSRPAARPATAPTPARPADRPAPAAPRNDFARLEHLNQQILVELKKLNESRHDDFSLSKLIAGIVQTLALAALPLAYVLYRNDAQVMEEWLLSAVFLQTFTVALLVMGRQK